jgi:hypothetical protein
MSRNRCAAGAVVREVVVVTEHAELFEQLVAGGERGGVSIDRFTVGGAGASTGRAGRSRSARARSRTARVLGSLLLQLPSLTLTSLMGSQRQLTQGKPAWLPLARTPIKSGASGFVEKMSYPGWDPGTAREAAVKVAGLRVEQHRCGARGCRPRGRTPHAARARRRGPGATC